MHEREIIVLQLEQAFQQVSWHGTNLLGSIRRLRPETAAWRPQGRRHNIWELIVHAAYWKYSVYRRFAGGRTGSFPIKGSNWFKRPVDPSETALRSDIELLKDLHSKLVDSVAKFDRRKFGDVPANSKTTFRDLAIGAAAHDLYHAGQIQMLKKLWKDSGTSRL
jgi:hypothetical protein